jgi:outer membrane protein
MKLICSIALLTFVFIGISGGQQPITLTLEKSVELALEKNTTVVQAQNNLDGRQSAVRAAYGQFLPSISLGGSYSKTESWRPATQAFQYEVPTNFTPEGGIPQKGTITSFSPGSSGIIKDNSYSTSISANLTLFDGFANTSSVSRANAASTAAEHTLNRTQQNIIYLTHQLFLNVVRTYELLKVSEDNLKRSKQQLERITESNKVGAVALADVYRQQVQAGTDELGLIQAQSNHEKAKADLVAELGVDFNTGYTFDFSGIPTDIDTAEYKTVNAQYSDFNNLTATADSKRTDYQSAIENYKSADASVTIARGAYYPTISTNLSYGYNNSEFSRLTDNRNLRFGIDISLPIFTGFATQDRVAQAEVLLKNADEEIKQKRRDITVEIRKALLDLEAAEKQVMVSQTTVASAVMDRKIAEEKYNLGAGTLLDLLVANANYTNSLSNKVNAVTNYLLAKKQTEFSVGVISK